MEQESTELRSEKTQHIIGKIPNIIVRAGITAIFFVLIILLLICYFIKTPNNATGSIVERTTSGIKVAVDKEFPNIGKIKCILKYETENIFSGDAEITETLKIIGDKGENIIYTIKMIIPDTITKGSEQIIIEDFKILKADLIGERERLLYKMIPILK